MSAEANERDEGVPDGGEGPEPPPRLPGGGIAIGSMTGGAVAAGHRARAQDESDRHDRPPASAGPVPPPAPGGISIGAMSGGAVAAGPDARAVDASRRAAGAVAASPELLDAVRALRAQLRLLTPSAQTAEVEGALAEVEAEITSTGQAGRGRLTGVRERLELGATAVGGLVSAATLAQVIGQLLG
ncbi:hypothetical protein ACZ90_66320 [Streptomyces albus subsp. albus]|nr:hypothetical protein ACZ90_66320 [Streptomyces albus subsp. albus]